MFYNFIKIQFILGNITIEHIDFYVSKNLISESQKEEIINLK